jgi:diphthine-ammonia ligase
MNNQTNKRVIISWSGGKDCCFALFKAMEAGLEPVSLFTSMPAIDCYTYGHGLGSEILVKQAEAMGIPIDIAMVETPDYRQFFLNALLKHKVENNIGGMVFGDLYLMEHRTWLEDVCKEAGIIPHFPLWMKPEEAYAALLEFISLGFESVVVKIRKEILGKEWVGRKIDIDFARAAKGLICPMGENGEFHSFVVNGPLFIKPLHIALADKTETEKELGITVKLLN